MNRPWGYFLVADWDGPERAQRLADEGREVILIRAPLGRRDWEQRLAMPDGRWVRSRSLADEQTGHSDQSFFPISLTRARQVAARWVELGRLTSVAAADEMVDEFVGDDVEAEVSAADARDAAAAELRSHAAIAAAEVDPIRSAVLDELGLFRAEWLARDSKIAVACASNRLPSFFFDDDSERVARAFLMAGVEDIVGVAVDEARLDGPGGFRLAPSAGALRAFSDQRTVGGVLLVASDLSCAILAAIDLGVVAGPREFVESVLDRTVPTARAEFADYAKAHPGDDRLQLAVRRFST